MRLDETMKPHPLVSWLGRGTAALESLFLIALSIGLAVLLAFADIAERLDGVLYDTLSRFAPAQIDRDILIVAIDNESLQSVGQWPWPRIVHAEAVNRLASARPRAIIYDILFAEPGRNKDGDTQLATAVAKARSVFLPILLSAPSPDGRPVATSGPFPPLPKVAAGMGQVIAVPDADGVLRRSLIRPRYGGRCWPNLAQVAASWLAREAADACSGSPGAYLIPFAGPSGTYPTLPISALLRSEVPSEAFKGKIVLVGAIASGLGDAYATPMENRQDLMSGVEVQANLLAALRHDALRREATPWLTLVVAAVLLGCLWTGFLSLAPRANLLLAAALVAGGFFTSVLLLRAWGLWLRPTPALVPIVVILPLWGWRRLAAASRYFLGELEALRHEPGLLNRSAEPVAHIDRIDLQIELFHGAVERMRELKHFVEQSLESLPDATLVSLADGSVAQANGRARDLWIKYAGASPQGSACSLLQSLRPSISEGADRLDQIVQSLERREPDEQECEIELVDGNAFLVRIRSCPGILGEPSFFIIRLTDISELRAVSRQRDATLQFISHDMRSPLSSILSLIGQAAASQLAPALADRIKAHARQAISLAEDFVQTIRAESAEYRFELIDMRDVVIDAMDMLWDKAIGHRAKINSEIEAEELPVLGDRHLLTRAISNLIDNAIKYGGPQPQILVRITGNELDEILCSVEDSGQGIAPDKREQLFQRFVREERSREGLGLGLALVRAVTERHGGNIACHSGSVGGARFDIVLPRAGTCDLGIQRQDDADGPGPRSTSAAKSGSAFLP